MYAIIEDSGTQIKVQEGDEIKIDRRELAEDASTLTFDKVLLVKPESSDAQIGQPYVAGATVTADIIEEGLEKKVEIYKFKRRKNYVRHRGHRQHYLKVKITGISG